MVRGSGSVIGERDCVEISLLSLITKKAWKGKADNERKTLISFNSLYMFVNFLKFRLSYFLMLLHCINYSAGKLIVITYVFSAFSFLLSYSLQRKAFIIHVYKISCDSIYFCIVDIGYTLSRRK